MNIKKPISAFYMLVGIFIGSMITLQLTHLPKSHASKYYLHPTSPFIASASTEASWIDAKRWVADFHNNNNCLFTSIPSGDTLPAGGPPELLSWWIDQASLDSCLNVNGEPVDGIRFYPIRKQGQDTLGNKYFYQNLLFVPTIPDTMSNGDIVHNNFKKAWDFTLGCPQVCNHDSLTRLGDDYVPPY